MDNVQKSTQSGRDVFEARDALQRELRLVRFFLCVAVEFP